MASDIEHKLVTSMLNFLRVHSHTTQLSAPHRKYIASLRVSLACLFEVTSDITALPGAIRGEALLALFNSKGGLAVAFSGFIGTLFDDERYKNYAQELYDIQEGLACIFAVDTGDNMAVEEVLHGRSLLMLYREAIARPGTVRATSAADEDFDHFEQAGRKSKSDRSAEDAGSEGSESGRIISVPGTAGNKRKASRGSFAASKLRRLELSTQDPALQTPTPSRQDRLVASWAAEINQPDFAHKDHRYTDRGSVHTDDEDIGDIVQVAPRPRRSTRSTNASTTKLTQGWSVVQFTSLRDVDGDLQERHSVRNAIPHDAFLLYNQNQPATVYESEGEKDWGDDVPDEEKFSGGYDLHLQGDDHFDLGKDAYTRITLQKFSNLKAGSPKLSLALVSPARSPKVRLTRRTKCERPSVYDIEFSTAEEAVAFTTDLEIRVHEKNGSSRVEGGRGGVASGAGGIQKGIATPKDMINMFAEGPKKAHTAEGLNQPCFCRVCKLEGNVQKR